MWLKHKIFRLACALQHGIAVALRELSGCAVCLRLRMHSAMTYDLHIFPTHCWHPLQQDLVLPLVLAETRDIRPGMFVPVWNHCRLARVDSGCCASVVVCWVSFRVQGHDL